MALTITDVSSQHPILNVGGMRAKLVTLTFDDSYPTGGESLTPADLGLAEIFAVLPMPHAGTDSGGFVFQYNYSTQKLRAYDEGAVADSPMTELANASADLMASEVRCLILGV